MPEEYVIVKLKTRESSLLIPEAHVLTYLWLVIFNPTVAPCHSEERSDDESLAYRGDSSLPLVAQNDRFAQLRR